MSDFSDRPFVAGSLIGLRAFTIDKYGRLLGPSVPQVFKPGENEAACRKDEVDARSPWATLAGLTFNYSFAPTLPSPFSAAALSAPRRSPSYGTGACPCGCGMEVEFTDGDTKSLAEKAVAPTTPPKPTHVLGGVKCTCGFYAYFDGLNDYKKPENGAAIIEGYGVCTVGDRGFRASKARLVALVEPKGKVSPLLRERLHRNYPDVPFYPSKREAVDAHPLTPPPTPGPDDDDFWTRTP